jgi:hypothetical protein
MIIQCSGLMLLPREAYNTPETTRRAKVAHCKLPQTFAADH